MSIRKQINIAYRSNTSDSVTSLLKKVRKTPKMSPPQDEKEPIKNSRRLNKSMEMHRAYSKPNIKPRHKLPALNLSNINSKPQLPIVSKEKKGKPSIIVKDLLTRKIHHITIKAEKDETATKPKLIQRIEQVLNASVEDIKNNEKKVDASKNQDDLLNALSKENAAISSYFGTLNKLLSDLVLCHTTENTSNCHNTPNKEAKLEVYKTEYEKLESRLSQLQDPEYPALLQSKCAYLEQTIEKLRQSIGNMGHPGQLLIGYKNTKVLDSAEDDHRILIEIEALSNALSQVNVQIRTCNEKLARSAEIVEYEKVRIQKLRDHKDKLANWLSQFNVSSKVKLQTFNNKRADASSVEYLLKVKEALKHTKREVDTKFVERSKELVNKVRELRRTVKSLSTQISEKEIELYGQRRELEELKEFHVEIDRENNAAKTIQRVWKKYRHNKIDFEEPLKHNEEEKQQLINSVEQQKSRKGILEQFLNIKSWVPRSTKWNCPKLTDFSYETYLKNTKKSKVRNFPLKFTTASKGILDELNDLDV